MGGEEFLLVLPGTGVRLAVRRLDAIRLAVATHAWDDITHGVPVTVSIGVAGLPDAPHRPRLICCPLRIATCTPPSMADAIVSWQARRVMK